MFLHLNYYSVYFRSGIINPFTFSLFFFLNYLSMPYCFIPLFLHTWIKSF